MIKNKTAYLTTTEAAKLLGFTPDYIRRLLLTNLLAGEKWGGHWIIKVSDLKKIKRQRKEKTKRTENGSN